MIFYHAVTDRPMRAGQIIRFDGTHHSGVYARVMEKLPLVEEIYARPEQAGELEHHTAVALRELALEEVRRKKYPMYPSRMSCLYVSETLEEAEKWAEFFVRWERPVYHIVKLDARGGIFRGEATKCFRGTPDRAENLRLAERYWENDPADIDGKPVREILVDGEIEVLEIVKEIRVNV
ncbi:MAG: DUF2441 domain-containing protein [Oscillospiraceae bacterium]|nr:DUF2441 domain-containing protein [Oscillospiraceae bacterium]